MTAVFFGGAEDRKIGSNMIENLRCGASNRLHAVIVGSNTVDEIQSVRGLAAAQDRNVAGLLEIGELRPLRSFLFHLPVRIAAAFQRLERFLEGLRHVPVVDHAAPQINDLVDILDQQRAFFLASTTCRARPDFILGENSTDEWGTVSRSAKNRIMLEAVISRLGGEKPRRQGPSRSVGGTLV